jgi:hypothetical protein
MQLFHIATVILSFLLTQADLCSQVPLTLPSGSCPDVLTEPGLVVTTPVALKREETQCTKTGSLLSWSF